jgi:hypothetical protein
MEKGEDGKGFRIGKAGMKGKARGLYEWEDRKEEC